MWLVKLYIVNKKDLLFIDRNVLSIATTIYKWISGNIWFWDVNETLM